MVKIVLIAVLCILGATLSKAEFNKEEIIAEFMVKAEDCRAEVGATGADIQDMIQKNPAAGKEAKCLRACVMKKYKVMDDNGKFVKAVGLEHAKKYTDGDAEKLKIATEIGETCATIAVSDDHCEAAVDYLKCFMEQAKAHGIGKFDL